VGGGGGLESKLSDQLWLSFSLALAKPNKKGDIHPNKFGDPLWLPVGVCFSLCFRILEAV
jgi:hypothetical protein